MSDASTGETRVASLLRDDRDAFDALRDTTADRYGVDPGAVEKRYWATEVPRHTGSEGRGQSWIGWTVGFRQRWL